MISPKENNRAAQIGVKDMRNLLDAIGQGGAGIEELDFWQDYISVPLNGFNLENDSKSFQSYSVV
jgi:hypothetical protein